MTPTWKANPVRSCMVVPTELAGLKPSAKLDTDHVRAPSTSGRASRRAGGRRLTVGHRRPSSGRSGPAAVPATGRAQVGAGRCRGGRRTCGGAGDGGWWWRGLTGCPFDWCGVRHRDWSDRRPAPSHPSGPGVPTCVIVGVPVRPGRRTHRQRDTGCGTLVPVTAHAPPPGLPPRVRPPPAPSRRAPTASVLRAGPLALGLTASPICASRCSSTSGCRPPTGGADLEPAWTAVVTALAMAWAGADGPRTRPRHPVGWLLSGFGVWWALDALASAWLASRRHPNRSCPAPRSRSASSSASARASCSSCPCCSCSSPTGGSPRPVAPRRGRRPSPRRRCSPWSS